MHPEVDELRPKLKEILYDCAVELKATKAALYLHDGTTQRYELVTEYGFRNTMRTALDRNDPVIDRCGRGRNAFFINGLTTEPRFSEILYAAGTDRMLVVPLYQRGQLVGLIDMRDKAAKLPFEQPDIATAQSIADRILALFASRNVFGLRFITLSDHDETPVPPQPQQAGPAAPAPVAAPPVQAPRPATAPAPKPVAVAPAPQAESAHVPRLATLVIDARSIASHILVSAAPHGLSEPELTAAREALRTFLLIPGVEAASFSAIDAGIQEIAARGPLSDDAKNVLQSKLNVWLSKRGESSGLLRTNVHASGTAPVTPAQLQKVFTAPVSHASYLTVAFSTNPDRAAHELLAVLLSNLQVAIEQAKVRGEANGARQRIAEKLLEPEFSKYPELRRHSEGVARICESFARHLGLSAAEIENARLLGLIHDVGMRLLDYERLYRKRDISPDELGILREHVAVGAAIIEPFLGLDLAKAVLCHHERVDGRGYPNELHGDEIPLLSRVLQPCDAWVAMTDPQSYQPNDPAPLAMAAIARNAGTQFDADLATKFVEMVRRG
ncbi:MAG TPA: HD domain-containing phosphohydrolase [Thermoanaerobaculia bacterium]